MILLNFCSLSIKSFKPCLEIIHVTSTSEIVRVVCFVCAWVDWLSYTNIYNNIIWVWIVNWERSILWWHEIVHGRRWLVCWRLETLWLTSWRTWDILRLDWLWHLHVWIKLLRELWHWHVSSWWWKV